MHCFFDVCFKSVPTDKINKKVIETTSKYSFILIKVKISKKKIDIESTNRIFSFVEYISL